jgi:hypothetical protein
MKERKPVFSSQLSEGGSDAALVIAFAIHLFFGGFGLSVRGCLGSSRQPVVIRSSLSLFYTFSSFFFLSLLTAAFLVLAADLAGTWLDFAVANLLLRCD